MSDEAIKNEAFRLATNDHKNPLTPEGGGYEKWVDEAIHLAKELEWISVEDRLPEDKVEVLGYFIVNPNLPGDREVTSREDNRWDYGGAYERTVTHWMPLPNPPTP